MELELFQSVIPKELLFDVIIFPCKAPLARLSIFDLTESSSTQFLFPGGTCQKQLQASVLSPWLPAVGDNIWSKQETKQKS